MAAFSGQQALTVVLPVRRGMEAELWNFLEDERELVRVKLYGVTSLHFARFVLIPRGEHASGAGQADATHSLLFESNFDGDVNEHFAELADELEPELTAMFEHCEGGGAGVPLEASLRAGSRRTSAFFSAHPGLTVGRVQTDARIRAAFLRWVRRERAAGAEQPPLALVQRVRAKLLEDFGPDLLGVELAAAPNSAAAGSLNGSAEVPSLAALGPLLREPGILPVLGRAAFHDVHDLLHALWADTKLDRTGVDARLERMAALESPGSQRALTHVVAVKPGRFRRRALASALRFARAWLSEADLVERGFGSSHFARWVELGDGRLVFLSHHDESLEAELGTFVERMSFLMSLVWSHTRDFPAGFAATFGGARDEARFKEWVRAKSVPTQITYSAYPALSVGDVRRGAELRALLGRKLDEPSARRALDLV